MEKRRRQTAGSRNQLSLKKKYVFTNEHFGIGFCCHHGVRGAGAKTRFGEIWLRKI